MKNKAIFFLVELFTPVSSLVAGFGLFLLMNALVVNRSPTIVKSCKKVTFSKERTKYTTQGTTKY